MNLSLSPPPELATFGGGDFHAVGREFFDYFVRLAGLHSHAHILEIGSGNGRMAAPLTSFLQDGTYEGFDAVEKAVRWCSESITPHFPRFHFHWFDIYNGFYSPRGTLQASTFPFPYPEACFDFVLLISVFTHMLPEDIRHYLHEIARVLRPGGCVFASLFLQNHGTEIHHRNGTGTMRFLHTHGQCISTDPAIPEKAVCFSETLIHAFLRETHLDSGIRTFYGSWNGRTDFLSFQDIIITTKRP